MIGIYKKVVGGERPPSWSEQPSRVDVLVGLINHKGETGRSRHDGSVHLASSCSLQGWGVSLARLVGAVVIAAVSYVLAQKVQFFFLGLLSLGGEATIPCAQHGRSRCPPRRVEDGVRRVPRRECGQGGGEGHSSVVRMPELPHWTHGSVLHP